MIAGPGNPLDDITLMWHVSFVMKGGVGFKAGGVAQAFHGSEPQ